MSHALESVGLSVKRGRATVLLGVDLSVAPGERWALLGANGSGKTSLLRAFAGLERPSGGTLRWQGQSLPNGAERTRRVGVLFQNEAPSAFTVRELVTLGLALDGPPDLSARQRVEQNLDTAGIAHLADRACSTLSGGELKRALLARALIAEPRLLLLDEPSNHLDPAQKAALIHHLDQLRGSVAVVLATHDLHLAASCDRVALLHSGRIAAVGAPDAVLTPSTLARCLSIRVRRIEDPDGGPPWLRVLAPEVAA